MRYLLLTLFLLTPLAAYAQDAASVQELCQQLENYQPAEGVEYQPGKDVDGNDVVPADVEGSGGQLALTDTVRVAITYDQAQQMNLPNVPYTPQMYIGNAEIKKDGSVYFNGKRLSQPQVQFLCGDKAGK